MGLVPSFTVIVKPTDPTVTRGSTPLTRIKTHTNISHMKAFIYENLKSNHYLVFIYLIHKSLLKHIFSVLALTKDVHIYMYVLSQTMDVHIHDLALTKDVLIYVLALTMDVHALTKDVPI